jgi:hypothetical protein
MTLLTDIERCVALRDTLAACSHVTLRMREDVGGASGSLPGRLAGSSSLAGSSAFDRAASLVASEPSGSAAAGDDSGSSSSSSSSGDEETATSNTATATASMTIQQRRKIRKAAAAVAKAQEKKVWRDVTVPVDPRLHPVYVLGRPLKRKDMRRGLASAASAEALKLGARDPATLAVALGLGAEARGGEDEVDEAMSSDLESDQAMSSDLESASSLASSLTGVGGDEAGRLNIQVPDAWREEIAETVLGRLDMLAERCTVLAIDITGGQGGGGWGVSAEGAGSGSAELSSGSSPSSSG